MVKAERQSGGGTIEWTFGNKGNFLEDTRRTLSGDTQKWTFGIRVTSWRKLEGCSQVVTPESGCFMEETRKTLSEVRARHSQVVTPESGHFAGEIGRMLSEPKPQREASSAPGWNGSLKFLSRQRIPIVKDGSCFQLDSVLQKQWKALDDFLTSVFHTLGGMSFSLRGTISKLAWVSQSCLGLCLEGTVQLPIFNGSMLICHEWVFAPGPAGNKLVYIASKQGISSSVSTPAQEFRGGPALLLSTSHWLHCRWEVHNVPFWIEWGTCRDDGSCNFGCVPPCPGSDFVNLYCPSDEQIWNALQKALMQPPVQAPSNFFSKLEYGNWAALIWNNYSAAQRRYNEIDDKWDICTKFDDQPVHDDWDDDNGDDGDDGNDPIDYPIASTASTHHAPKAPFSHPISMPLDPSDIFGAVNPAPKTSSHVDNVKELCDLGDRSLKAQYKQNSTATFNHLHGRLFWLCGEDEACHYYIVLPGRSTKLKYSVILHEPGAALQVIHSRWGPDVDDIAMHLMSAGIQFATAAPYHKLAYHPALSPKISLGFWPFQHILTFLDYKEYVLQWTLLVTVQIPWFNQDLWRMLLSAELHFTVEEIICSVYKILTGQHDPTIGQQQADVSWWAKQSTWESSRVDMGYWMSDNKAWYQSFLLNAGQWCNALKIHKCNRDKILTANYRVAENFFTTP
ncbi:hypothetical protein J3A83DRAFT_4194296 [Scleroderma citrinum]